MQTVDAVILGQYEYAWEGIKDKKLPHGTQALVEYQPLGT